ncbi:MAG: LysM domain-containing protein, partial [Chloroflexi bacterium]|nr:LysM domain-containing protein [Chloroflexota bacterium]
MPLSPRTTRQRQRQRRLLGWMTAVFFLAAVAIVLAAPRAALPTIESAKALTITLIARFVPLPAAGVLPAPLAAAAPELLPAAPAAQPSAVPVRARWEFGALLPYVVQSGDTLPALAARFNQTTDAILKANPALAVFQSTLPPGRAINIPASYAPLLGSAFQILPDSAVVYAEDPGDLAAQLQNFDGWLAHRH